MAGGGGRELDRKSKAQGIERMTHRIIPGWTRGAKGRWRVMSKRNPKPLLWLMSPILLLVFVIISVGYRRKFLMLAGPETSYQAQLPGQLKLGEHDELFICDRSQLRADICNIKGDIRMQGNKSFVLYSKDPATAHKVEIVKPYTRKWEQSCMETVQPVTLRILPATDPEPPACDVHHTVPGVVFSNGGYTGNLYHDFNDGLIPLFITSQHLHRDVVFVITEFHHWWFTKYIELVQELSNHDIVDFHNDTRVHCFRELELGLHIHDELTVDPARMPNRETVHDFRDTLNRGYTATQGVELETVIPTVIPTRIPRLTIIVRNDTRKMLNLEGIMKTAEEVGFNVEVLIPDRYTELKHVFRLLNKTEVLLGVHGAALTHLLFMRPGTVVIQVIPLGTDWAARTYFGEPAVKLGLRYLPFKITPGESTLSEKYNRSDPILSRPNEVLKQRGWWDMKAIYLEGQDVRPSLARMRTTLLKALRTLQQQSP